MNNKSSYTKSHLSCINETSGHLVLILCRLRYLFADAGITNQTVVRVSQGKCVIRFALIFVLLLSQFLVAMPAFAFQNGDRVQATENLNVRSCYFLSCSLLTTVPSGSKGTILNGPYSGDGYTWWYIDWDAAPTGYSAQGDIYGNWITVLPPNDFTLSQPSTTCNGTSPQVELSWQSATGAAKYEVYRGGSLYINAGTSLSYTDSNVSSGSVYTYSIRAWNSDNSGSTFSNAIVVTVPTCLGPAAITIGPSQLDYGSVQIGTCSTASFSIQHQASTQAAAGSISVSPSSRFTLTSSSSFSLSNGQSVYKTVQFCPDTTGSLSGSASISSNASMNISAISLIGVGFNPQPTTGAIQVNASLNGSPWIGSIDYSISGPVNIVGNTTPADFQDSPAGAYTLTYNSSGPTGASYQNVSPSSSQVLSGGGIITFTLNFVTAPPTVTTAAGNSNSPTSAVILGTVNPNGSSTDAWHEWGTTTSYGNSTTPQSIGSGTTVIQVPETLTGLSAGVTYHFRTIAQNAGGTVYGDDASFTMPSPASVPPSVTTGVVKNMADTFATLEGTVNPNGAPNESWYEWGVDSNYGNTTDIYPYGGIGTDPIGLNVIITGLTVGTTYHYRIVSQNSAGIDYGADRQFTLGAAAVNGIQEAVGYAADPVNTATGNYVYKKRDLIIPGPGMPFEFMRTYNSLAPEFGPLGFGWHHTYDTSLISIMDASAGVTYKGVKWNSGALDIYTPNTTGGFDSPYGVFDKLVDHKDGTYSIIKKDKTIYDFDSLGRLASITDKNGNTINLTYTGDNLVQITDTASRNIGFTYDTSERITQIVDPISRTISFDYDSDGNLSSTTDANGNTTNYYYDSEHRLTSIIDARGYTLVANTYDAVSGRVTLQNDAKGNATTYSYDDIHRITTITNTIEKVSTHEHDENLRLINDTDSSGGITAYTYDSVGNRISILDKNGNLTQYGYDANGNVTFKTDALSNTTSITYDANNNPLTRTDALSNVTDFAYDANGNLIQTQDPLSNTTSISYDTRGMPLTVTDARGYATANTYDTEGNLIRVEDALGNITRYTYDGVGRRITNTDALGRTTAYTYDNNDNLLSITDPAANTITYTYDGNDNKLTETDRNGNLTQFVYDEKNLLASTTDALNGVVTSTYDALDRRITTQDKNGNTAHHSYDAIGNLIQKTDAMGNIYLFAYDPNGNRTSATNPINNTVTYVFDPLNRVIEVHDAINNITATSYNALGKKVSVTNPKGQTTSFSYDALGRLTLVQDANGGNVQYTYDQNGNRASVIDPNGNETTYMYDALNRLTTKVEPLNNTTQYQYDAVGNLIQLNKPDGTNIQYEHDSLNRLSNITYQDASTASFSYDANGNRTQMEDTLGTQTYTYDALNRRTAHTGPFGNTVAYDYDSNNNRTSLVYPDGKAVTYAYDALNRMITVTDWLTNTTSYGYDEASRLTNTTLPNGSTVTYGYDNASRLTSLTNAKADASIISSYSYTLDSLGNHIAESRDEPLMPILMPGTVTYTHDTENRLIDANNTINTFDNNGNMTAKGIDSYVYDFENRLKEKNIGGVTTQYQYDGLGNRYSRTSGGASTRFILDTNADLANILADTDVSNNITAYNVYGLGLIARIQPDGTANYYHYDSRGSTIALTDSSGLTTDTYAYDPFGKPVNRTGATLNPFTYIGRYGVMDEGDDLFYIRARYYDSEQQRFIRKDPKAGNDQDGQSLNRYAYGLNNPVMFVDISGYCPNEPSSGTPKNNVTSDGQHAELVDRKALIRQLQLEVAIAIIEENAALELYDIELENWINIFGGIEKAADSYVMFYLNPVGFVKAFPEQGLHAWNVWTYGSLPTGLFEFVGNAAGGKTGQEIGRYGDFVYSAYGSLVNANKLKMAGFYETGVSSKTVEPLLEYAGSTKSFLETIFR